MRQLSTRDQRTKNEQPQVTRTAFNNEHNMFISKTNLNEQLKTKSQDTFTSKMAIKK